MTADRQTFLKPDAREKLLKESLRITQARAECEGRVVSYQDINEEIAKALATAEDELTRAPTSELVMGEIIALRRLAAHFAPAPAFYEHRREEAECALAELMADTIGSMADSLLGRARTAGD